MQFSLRNILRVFRLFSVVVSVILFGILIRSGLELDFLRQRGAVLARNLSFGHLLQQKLKDHERAWKERLSNAVSIDSEGEFKEFRESYPEICHRWNLELIENAGFGDSFEFSYPVKILMLLPFQHSFH